MSKSNQFQKVKNKNRINKVQTAILLGNGINLLTEGVTWAGLLNQIAQHMGVVVEINNNKTFPMIFEEILFRSEGNFYYNLRTIKEHIANEYLITRPNLFHNQVMKLNVTDYLTTNYDYSLEKVFEPNFNISCETNKEWKYSIFRKNTVNQNKKIWHIHGEINNDIKRINRYSAESIMIGNEHYGDYFRKIHEYIKPPGGNVIDGLKREPESWIQKFFTHDIHIIGFSLDFSETHLWWLLNLRARIIESINITIANKIYFYYPSFEQEQYGPKIQLLEAIHVNCIMIPIDENNGVNRYIDYWNNILNHQLNHLNA
jgi:hypothetical protein